MARQIHTQNPGEVAFAFTSKDKAILVNALCEYQNAMIKDAETLKKAGSQRHELSCLQDAETAGEIAALLEE